VTATDKLREAAARLHAARPDATIILFGSRARGDARTDSDADFLVVQPEVTSRRAEMTALSNLLRPLRLPADVLVASRRTFEKWAAVPGTIYHTALKEGRVLYGQA
jgi:predicted nucleotidyltransferase